MLTRRAKRFCAATEATTASTGATGPAITSAAATDTRED
jgi:hypothetical protein